MRCGWKVLACAVAWCGLFLGAQTRRDTLSLNGQWQVEDSVDGDRVPVRFTHMAPVPGLTHSAIPAFQDVDQFQSRELLSNMVRRGTYSRSDYDKLGLSKGISKQKRNYFWYHRSFAAHTGSIRGVQP